MNSVRKRARLQRDGCLMKRWIVFLCAILFSVQTISAESRQQSEQKTGQSANHVFESGEKLTYNISWSNIFQAGTSVMEISDERTRDNRAAYRVVSTTQSSPLITAFFPVLDIVQSVFDAHDLSSLSYDLNESHGRKKRRRSMVFDPANKTVREAVNGREEIFSVPGRVQDALSSLYYLRAQKVFSSDRPIVIAVHESGKNWSVEVQTLGREKIRTSLGEFDTIKVKTYPKYEGVFQNKGEIFIWLTDDARKIPVRMKSTITIGSIVATLTNIHAGKGQP